MSFFEELKRRNVVRVAVAYVITAWLLLQVSDVFINNIGAPDWLFQAIVFVLAIGFPVVVIFSWAFEITPDGIKREVDVPKDQSIVAQTAHKLDRAIIIMLVLAVAYFIWESRFAERPAPAQNEASAEQALEPAEAVAEDPPAPSIAVLPFADMSPGKDQEYFSDGIAEELLNLLVRVDGLQVASRTSSFSYKNTPLNIAEIAGELKVDRILEGSVRKADNRVRITAQLIDAATDRHLWSDTYDRELKDIFSIQDEIANAIVHALQAELGIENTGRAVTVETATENLNAYELYLQARGLFLARSDLKLAISLFENAVELDPQFARAWADLSANYAVMNSWGHFDRDYPSLAAEAAQTALDINPELSTPWAVRAQFARTDGDFITSEQYLEKAIALDPKDATHYLWRGINLSVLGFQNQAMEEYQKCLQLDPMYENCRRHVAAVYFILGDNDQAMTYYLEGATPGYRGMKWVLNQRFITLGQPAAVALVAGRIMNENPGFPGKEVFEALRNPRGDHSRGLQKLLEYRESTATPPSSGTFYFAFFRAWRLIEPSTENVEWIWLEENRDFLQSEYFKPWAEKSGLVAYWRDKGFPPRCRPVGDDNFECE